MMKRWMSFILAVVLLMGSLPMNVLAAEDGISVTALSVTNLPDKLRYSPGEALDLTGLTADAAYSDGSVKSLTAGELTVVKPDLSTPGNKTVKVACGSQSASFEIHVHDVKVLPAVAPTYTSSGLTEGKVCADTSCGEVLVAQKVLDPQGVPNLKAPSVSMKVTEKGVELSWNKVEHAEGYQICRKTGNGSWEVLGNMTSTSWTDTGAKSGAQVQYLVRAWIETEKGLVCGDDSKAVQVFFVAVTMSNVTDGVSLKWTSLDGASYYRIYRRVPGGSWKTICSKTTESSYTDAGAEAGVTYQYAVRANRSGSFTNYHYNLNFIRLVQPKANAVNGAGGVKITWDATAGADSYNVYRKLSGGSWKLLGSASGTEYLDTTAKSGKNYVCRVRAKSGSTLSSGNKTDSLLYLAQPAMTLTNVADGVKVAWKAVDGANSYRIYRKIPGGSWEVLKKGLTGSSYTDTEVSYGKTYQYSVRAYNDGTMSAYHADARMLRLEQPKASVSNRTSGVQITWNTVSKAESYNVYRKVSGGEWKLLSNETGTAYVDTTVEGGVSYSYRVRAKSGSTLSSNKHSAAILRLTNPAATASVANTGVSVKWEAVKGADSYRVYRKTEGSSWKQLATKVTELKYTDTSAKSGITYYYYVSAYGDGSLSSYTGTEAITFLARPEVKVKSSTVDSITISWNAVEGATKYRLYQKTESGSWKDLGSVSGTGYTFKNLTTGQSYTYAVRAVSDSAKSTRSAEVTVAATYPAPSYTVKLEPTEGIRISWDAVEGAGSYQVYRRTKGGSWKTLKTTSKTSLVDGDGKAGTTYEYAVRAFQYANAEGVSGQRATGKTIVYSKVDPKKPMIALTFDDGPSQYTAGILDKLEEYGAHATFFVVGQRVSSYAKTIKRAYDMGCEIGNHSWSHPSLSSISVSKMKSELSKTDAAIEKVIGKKPDLLRPPYGAVDSDVKKYAGKPLIHWSIDTRDWEHRNSSKTISSVMNNVRDGSIILMHDVYKATRTAAVALIPKLIAKGYQLVTVSELAAYKGVNLKDGKIYYNIR